MTKKTDRVLDYTKEMIAIDSPTGFTAKATEYAVETLNKLGFAPDVTRKGSVLAEIGGEGSPLVLTAHLDTLGGIVCEIKSNGRLRISNLGGLRAANCETENVRVYARNGNIIDGCLQLCNASTFQHYRDRLGCGCFIQRGYSCTGNHKRLFRLL